MIESKFNKAYLQIIKEDYDGFLPKENEVSATAETEEVPASDALKQVTFVTSDKALIDAINSGFEEIVIFVNAKDETTGEDTITEVKIGKDSFGDITVTDVEEDKEEEEEEDADDEEAGDVDDEVEECGDVEGGDEASVESEETEIEEEVEDAGDESGDEASVESEETEIEEEEEENKIDPSEWVEDGVCVKCQSADCDGSCKCEKCGDVNCIGDCQ